MKTNLEYLDYIVSRVRDLMNHTDSTFELSRRGKTIAKIYYGFSDLDIGDSKDENTHTNFDVWTKEQEWNEYQLSRENVISYIQNKIPELYLLSKSERSGKIIYIDVVFTDLKSTTQGELDFIVEGARSTLDQEEFQSSLDEGFR